MKSLVELGFHSLSLSAGVFIGKWQERLSFEEYDALRMTVQKWGAKRGDMILYGASDGSERRTFTVDVESDSLPD